MTDLCPHCHQPMPSACDPSVQDVANRWNKVASELRLPLVRKPASYAAKIKCLLGDEPDLDVLEAAFRVFGKQDFIRDRRYGFGNFLPHRLKYLDRAREGEGVVGGLVDYRAEIDALGGSPGIDAINTVRRRYGMKELV